MRKARLGLLFLSAAACSESAGDFLEPAPTVSAESAVASAASLPAVSVDGVLEPREWRNSRTWKGLSILLPGGGTTTGDLYVRNDLEHLYFGFILDTDQVYEVSNVLVQFFNDGVGPLSVGDDYVIGYAGSVPGSPGALYDGYYDYTSTGFRGIGDGATGGTVDGTAAGGLTDGRVTIEIQHPLNSGDVGHDLAVAPGDLIQFRIQVTVLSEPYVGVKTIPLPYQELYIQCRRNQKANGPDRPPRC